MWRTRSCRWKKVENRSGMWMELFYITFYFGDETSSHVLEIGSDWGIKQLYLLVEVVAGSVDDYLKWSRTTTRARPSWVGEDEDKWNQSLSVFNIGGLSSELIPS